MAHNNAKNFERKGNFGDDFLSEEYPAEDFDFDGMNNGPYHDGNMFMGGDGWYGEGPSRGGWGRPNYGMQVPPPNYGNNWHGPGFAFGRGFGPDGPPLQRNRIDCPPIRYLLRCGVLRENLRNLPRNFLDLIEPGYCGVCDMSLDSFAMSRSHYTSKNHWKKQKNWMLAQVHPADMGSNHPKNEMPFKARELYCELCDVHITSKVHADSHYAGKPHRAIVDGRKKPKNLALQRRGMGVRLEQLIRREKKYLKPLGETVKPKEEEPKAFQPELFCDICKTTVTCSEQMTMHLNGKRHLSKEKQHILKMMKAGASEHGKDKDAEDVEEGPEKVTSKDSQAGEDKYDWGNGSGAWDDSDQTPQVQAATG